MANQRYINYVTIEDPASGLFQTQVLDVVTQSVQAAPGVMRLCVFIYPWHLFSNRKCLANLRRTCKDSQICIRIYPVLFPIKYSLRNTWWFYLTMTWLTLIAQLLPKCNVAHCRGYFAAYMGLKCRSTCKVVFDMRSSWVDENVAAGRLSPESRLHSKWLELERFCLRSAAHTLGVSSAMERLARRGPSLLYDTIPIAANASLIGFSESFRNRMRKQFGWEHCHVAVYSGSFGLNRVNVNVLTQLFSLLGRSECNLKFLFLTREDPKLIWEILRESGIDESAARCYSVSAEILGDYLSIADFGIHALPDQPDAATRLGTKVVEYWMNGLPALVTPTVGAAAQIIRDFGVGQVLSLDLCKGDGQSRRVDISGLNRENFFPAFKVFDTRQFDVRSVAAKYISVYELLLQSTAAPSTPATS